MFEGKLMGIIAANALELGVDTVSLDAVIAMGFPHFHFQLTPAELSSRAQEEGLSVGVVWRQISHGSILYEEPQRTLYQAELRVTGGSDKGANPVPPKRRQCLLWIQVFRN